MWFLAKRFKEDDRMLVLSRNVGERVFITCGCGRRLAVFLARARAGSARIGIEADREVVVLREEVPARVAAVPAERAAVRR